MAKPYALTEQDGAELIALLNAMLTLAERGDVVLSLSCSKHGGWRVESPDGRHDSISGRLPFVLGT